MTTTACTRPVHTTSGSATPRLQSALHLITGAFSARSSRRALARLDRAALDDLGLDPHEAACEAARPLWDVPAAWRR